MVALSEMNTITQVRVFSVATVPTYDQLGMITGIYTYSTPTLRKVYDGM